MFIKNESGFTLVESLLHCVVFLIAMFGLAMILVIALRIPTPEDAYVETEFEVVSFDFNRLLLDNVTRIEQKVPEKLSIYPPAQEDMYEVFIAEQYLFRSKAGGFEPLTLSLKAGSNWTLSENRIILRLIFENDTEMERAFYVPTIAK